MRYRLLLLAPLVALAGYAEPAQAQDSSAVYRPVLKPVSPAAAVGLEYLLPTLGHAYAGDWVRGFPPLLTIVAGGVLVVGGIVECECLDSAEITTGLVVMVGGRLWGLYSAYDTARDRNRANDPALARALRLRVRGLSVSLAVPL
ncbi:MAG: hypothetical protein AAGI91_13880 [Bacteroidota bacterium]